MLNLESVFRQIEQERMHDVPVLNSALKVQAVGFMPWETYALGVLITPWFMNLMLIPDPQRTESGGELRTPGSKRTLRLPSGSYEFIAGEEQGIGSYEVCSLFSPMFEFADQVNAVATAEAIMLALMDEENQDETTMHEETIRQIWEGQEQAHDLADNQDLKDDQIKDKNSGIDQPIETGTESTIPQLRRLKDQKISRRSLLRGEFLDRRE